MDPKARRAYWRRNLRYVAVLLGVWFLVSFAAGILFVDELDKIRIAGFKLGFWFAQQGSIYAFVGLIFVYVYLMNRLDKEYGVDDDKGMPPARIVSPPKGATESDAEPKDEEE